MSWHSFRSGQAVRIEQIERAIETYLRSGKVKDIPTKRIYLAEILNSGYRELTYSPVGEGWGNTPLNPHCWISPDGNRLGYVD